MSNSSYATRFPGVWQYSLLLLTYVVALMVVDAMWGGSVVYDEPVPDLYSYYRLPGHADSWIALVIIAYSFVTAAALNYVAPRVRTGGTVLAAMGCLAVSAWFFYVVQTGFLENPKISPVVNDPLKPAVMWINAIFGFAAGVFLLRVALWQSRHKDKLVLRARNTELSFGGVSRYLHWTIAILILTMLPMGVFTAMIPEDVPWRQGYYVVHKTIGFLVLFLALMRLVWHRVSKPPALDDSLKPWEKWLAKPAHYLLYFLMLAFPLSGYALSTFGGRHSHFFVWDTPNLWGMNLAVAWPFGIAHKVLLPYAAYVVIGAHVIGALKHHFIDTHRESIHRMVA